MGALTGKRILIVEDEALIAAMVSDMLEDAGADVIGPASNIQRGVALANDEALDAAVLDMNVGGKKIDEVADILEARGIPMLFATGYSHIRQDMRPGMRVLNKPYVEDALIAALTAMLNGSGKANQAAE